MTRSRLYLKGHLDVEGLDDHQLLDRLADPDSAGGFGWLDVSPSDSDAVVLIAAATGLPAAAITLAAPDPRPSVDVSQHRLLLSLPLLRFDADQGAHQGVLHSRGMSVVVTTGLLVTCTTPGSLALDEVEAIWDRNSTRAGDGLQFLVHGIFSVYLQQLQDAVEALDDHVLHLEDEIVDADMPGSKAGRYRQLQLRRRTDRRALVRMRSVIMLLPSVVDTLNDAAASVGLPGYFSDHDRRVNRLVSRTEIIRETLTSLLEMELTAHGNQLNVVMRRLTAFAGVFAVIAAITGYYGMNVHTWPEAGSRMGGLIALGLIVFSVTAVLLTLRRRGWL